MANDTTKITFPIYVHLDGEAREKALARLCAIHGYPDGIPVDERAPEALRSATHRLLLTRAIMLEIVVDLDGTPIFRMVTP